MKKLAGCILALLLISCHSSKVDPVRWHIHLKGRAYADPIIDVNRVYIVSSVGEVLCISLQDGTVVWRKNADSPIVAAPAYDDRFLFVGTQKGTILSFNKQTGDQNWRRNFGSEEGFEAPLTATSQYVLAPSATGKLYAVSKSNGLATWTHVGTGKYSSGAVLAGSRILIGEWGGDFFCLQADGMEEWKFKAAARIVDPVSVIQNTVLVPTHGRFLYALDVPSGRQLWRFQTDYPTFVALFQRHAVFGSGTRLYVLAVADGRLEKKIDMQTTILNVRSSQRGCLVVTDAAVYDVDIATASKREVPMPNRQHPYKIADSALCYIITDDLYSVFCIGKE